MAPSHSKWSLQLSERGWNSRTSSPVAGCLPRDVWTFMPIAVETCQCEVVSGGRAAVLAGDDVVDMERQRVSRGRKLAVFTAAPRSLPYLPREIGIHSLPAEQGKPGFGLDHGEQVADMQVAVEFGALIAG